MTDHNEARPAEGRADEGAAPDQPTDDSPAELRAQLDEARDQADELRRKAEAYLDLAQRAQADFQNYKRRTEQERERTIKDANADLLRQILPALDDLERALNQVPGELAEHTWTQGVSLVGQKLQRTLEQQGLTRIGAEGDEFDPHVHEAVAYEEHPEYGEGQIAQVYRPGYRLHDRVLRPAQVTVARAAEPSVSEASVSSPARADESPPQGRGRAAKRRDGVIGEGHQI
jgi:molecular chaperone GrpE